jgi:hypothetical protein
MRIRVRKGYILVISEGLVNFQGFLGGVGKRAKGTAFFPFIFVRSEEFNTSWLITHEKIHFRQQLETLFIGSILLMICERLYARFFLNKTNFEAYLWGSGEQEAYLNQHNENYLKTRKLWAQFSYLKHKKSFTLGAPGEVIQS